MNGPPDALYVCDVGAGTGAGLVGLSLALSDWPQKPIVYFDAVEPSDAMRRTGELFWKSFSRIRNSKYDIVGKAGSVRAFKYTPDELPNLPNDALRIVSAFHLSFLYDVTSIESRRVFQSCHESVESVVSLVAPDHGLFTVNRNKVDSLARAANEVGGWSSHNRESAPTAYQLHGRHTFFAKCGTDLGFPPKYSPYGHHSRYIFPRDAVLLSVERLQAAEERRRKVEESQPRRKEAERQDLYSAAAQHENLEFTERGAEKAEPKRGQAIGCAVAVVILTLIVIIVAASMYVGF